MLKRCKIRLTAALNEAEGTWLISWGQHLLLEVGTRLLPLPQIATRAPNANLHTCNTGFLTQFCLHLFFFQHLGIMALSWSRQSCLWFSFAYAAQKPQVSGENFPELLRNSRTYFQCNEALNPSLFWSFVPSIEVQLNHSYTALWFELLKFTHHWKCSSRSSPWHDRDLDCDVCNLGKSFRE